MSRLRIGAHEVNVSDHITEQITQDQAQRAGQFAAALGVSLERLIGELETPKDDRSTGAVRRAVERVVEHFNYVDSGVRAIAALHYVSIPKRDDEVTRNAES